MNEQHYDTEGQPPPPKGESEWPDNDSTTPAARQKTSLTGPLLILAVVVLAGAALALFSGDSESSDATALERSSPAGGAANSVGSGPTPVAAAPAGMRSGGMGHGGMGHGGMGHGGMGHGQMGSGGMGVATTQPTGLGPAVERGRFLFETHMCARCHGVGGAGGVANLNYVRGTIPPLAELADRLMLYSPQEAETVVELIEAGVDPRERAADPPFDGYARFLAQYESVLGVITNGAVAAKADPDGPIPPLQMQPWGHVLNETDRRALIAYLITLYDWGEEGGSGQGSTEEPKE